MILKKLKTAFCLMLMFLMLGCSVRTHFYIQNLSDESKLITIMYKTHLSDPDKRRYIDNLNFYYAEGLYSRKKFREDNSGLSLLEKKVKDSSVQFIIPPKSTVRIDKSHNYRWSENIDYVEIENLKVTQEEFRANTEHRKHDILYNIQ
ncbi:hypothetical protein [Chryseobacterium wangxinyae]|uniref:hypothetical protein n=1 Tax=Chryseobacterium sp. CY353 TaxID=2997334 RepID=UPI00227214CE|nr:hypothetical protein [Chryseobacterium sp. CY353]